MMTEHGREEGGERKAANALAAGSARDVRPKSAAPAPEGTPGPMPVMATGHPEGSPGWIARWWMAARPKTLAAAAVPVAVGSAVAAAADSFVPLVALSALVGAFLIQVGTNFANDYYDFLKGADTEARVGPTRVTQAGLIAPEAVRRAMVLTFALAALVGLHLVLVGGWPIVIIGILSIICGIAYTGGPWPLGYNGLGDLFVFLFFGLVAVVTTAWLQLQEWSWLALLAAIPIGFLSTAIIVVNNLRDAETDAVAGKRTLAVRFGVGFARAEYALLVWTSFAFLPLLAFLLGSPAPLLALLALPFAVRGTRSVYRERGAPLNDTLALSARILAVYGLLLSLGIVLAGRMGG